jgi:futalosine hydrolase
VTVAVTGVGPVAAAAGTARLLALAEAGGTPYRTVVSAGIAGGFIRRVPVGGTVLARRSIQADLGAQEPGGFLTLDQLGFGTTVVPADEATLARLTESLRSRVYVGDVLTVSTVTGTVARAVELASVYPEALAEAMEGYGVACAATAAGAAFVELRTVSNTVGPRERGSWRVDEALAALTRAAPALAELAR